jgi:hypothetical protein
VPGLHVSELLPNLARRADRYAIVRTVHHRHSGHNAGMYWSIVGRPYRVDGTLMNPSRTDYPSFGTLVGWLARRDGYSGALPPYVITPAPHCDSRRDNARVRSLLRPKSAEMRADTGPSGD